MHEASLYDFNSFITLTYAEESCPRSLVYRHFQLFMKRLRKEFPQARFYMCGEYGELYGRPHFHSCLFNVHFSDRYFWRTTPSGCRSYRSALLERLWPHGNAEIGDVTFESAAYVARYVMKKVTGKNADEHYQRFDPYTGEIYQVEPEFTRMSLKPGIGFDFVRLYHAEMYPRDEVVMQGRKLPPPKYYDKIVEHLSSADIDSVRYSRELKAARYAEDTTPQRLRVREQCAKARVGLKSRHLE